MIDNDRWGIIYCPKQGIRRSTRRWEQLQEALDAAGIAYDFVQSESPESVGRLTTMLCRAGYRTLIVCGGDGALNRAVCAVMEQPADEVAQTAIGVIPGGRGNDFATFWGFSEKDDRQTVAWLRQRRLRRIDVGYISCTDGSGTTYFINCVNIGLVANILKLKYRSRRIAVLATLTYIGNMLQLMFQRPQTRVRLHVNEETIEQKAMNICVGNASGYGQTPSAVPYNGMLDVSIVSHPKVTGLIIGLWKLLTRRFLGHKNVRAYRTPRPIAVADIHSAGVATDGRVRPDIHAPFEIGILPEHLNFIIPA